MPTQLNTIFKPKRLIQKAVSSALLSLACIQPANTANFNIADFDKPIEGGLTMGEDDAKYGKFKVDLRYRFELSDVANNGKETAYANTLRLRLGYLTPTLLCSSGKS
jgi:hypothetical protein